MDCWKTEETQNGIKSITQFIIYRRQGPDGKFYISSCRELLVQSNVVFQIKRQFHLPSDQVVLLVDPHNSLKIEDETD